MSAPAQAETLVFPRWMTPAFLTSDTHLGHANILDYCPGRRSWAVGRDKVVRDIRDHDFAICSGWEAVVGQQTVLHLGDFAFGSPDQVEGYRQRLPGLVSIVAGNHDRSATWCRSRGFVAAGRRATFECEGLRVCCRHRPKDFTAEEAAEFDALFHGHTHTTATDPGSHRDDALAPGVAGKLYDVGVDRWGPRPVLTHVHVRQYLAGRSEK